MKRAAIFGSFARGEATQKSDIDFLIEYQSKKKSLFDFVNLKFALEDALKCKVDLVTYNSLCWQLKDRILAELDSAGAQLASLAADLKASRAVLQARLKRPPPFMPLEEYDGHFANAFTHIEKAKMAVRAMHPVCHQADFLKKKTEKNRR